VETSFIWVAGMWLATDTFDKSWKMPDIEMVKQ
jgi:hypothetical protein